MAGAVPVVAHLLNAIERLSHVEGVVNYLKRMAEKTRTYRFDPPPWGASQQRRLRASLRDDPRHAPRCGAHVSRPRGLRAGDPSERRPGGGRRLSGGQFLGRGAKFREGAFRRQGLYPARLTRYGGLEWRRLK